MKFVDWDRLRSEMFAVISSQGNQYKVELDREYRIDRLLDLTEDQKEITFSDVLLVGDDKQTLVGQPTIPGASVLAEIVGEIKDKKVRVFKFKAKKRYKRGHNHRQSYSLIKIKNINQG